MFVHFEFLTYGFLILPFTNSSCASLGWAVILPHQGFSFEKLRVEFSAVPGG
jgi:hypothetical protein